LLFDIWNLPLTFSPALLFPAIQERGKTKRYAALQPGHRNGSFPQKLKEGTKNAWIILISLLQSYQFKKAGGF
jgi:hypothetical protein